MSNIGAGKLKGVVAAGLLSLLVGSPALGQFVTSPQEAQKKQQLMTNPTPPKPRKADDPPVLWMMGLTAILLLGIAGAALIPSKRGHQD